MTYQCLKIQRLHGKNNYTLVHLRQKDFESIRQWRNAQIDVLRQKHPLSEDEQQLYFSTVIEPSFYEEKPAQILFSFLHDDTCIGYGGLTHIDWESLKAEVSFLLNPKYEHPDEAWFEFITLLRKIAFEHLKLHRIYAEVYATRPALIPLFEKSGFHLEGHLRDHVFKAGKWQDSYIYGMLEEEKSW